jgi:ABC-2 type transport system permease protein
MRQHLLVLLGALRYEFRMQIRRPAVWITIFAIAAIFTGILTQGPAGPNTYLAYIAARSSLLTTVATWTAIIGRGLPIGVGVLLADRLIRDRRTKVEELFTSAPGALSSRLAGKYLGSMLATLVPLLIVYMLGIGQLLYITGDVRVLLLAPFTFIVITLPGILFITAFSLACPMVMWVPLYQFCFIGYWFWGNELSPRQGIPTLSTTILTPIGGYMANGFFGVDIGFINATPLQGVESMLLLLGIALLVMVSIWGILKWQQARQ